MIVCQNCHTPNAPGAVLCFRCGAELPRGAGATIPAEPLGVAPPAPPAPPPLGAPAVPHGKGSTVDDPGLRGHAAPVGPYGTALGLGAHAAPLAPPPAPPPASVAYVAPPPASVAYVAPTAPGRAAQLEVGEVVDGKYRLESVLGEGGMGIVFLATDLVTDTKVVVKALHTALVGSEQFRTRVRAEARALAQIDHPNVVRLNAVVSGDSSLLLVMQYVDGRSLDRVIQSRYADGLPFGAEEALGLFRQIVLGVAAAHGEGVVHRDIKPANVLVRAKDGIVKVTDFGIAKTEDDAKAGRGVTQGIIGSLWYMAPEQVTGRRDLDKRVDIYALGIVLFELLVGRVPFDAQSDYEIMKMHTEAPVPSVRALRPDLPPELDAIIARATAKDRDDRYPTCDAMVADLDQLLFTLRPDLAPMTSRLSMPNPPARPATAPHVFAAEEPKKTKAPLFIALAVVGLGAAGAAAFAAGAFDAPAKPATSAPVRPSASPSSSVRVEPADAFASLQGRWVSDTGRHYDAVLAGTDVEFRVRDPEEFPRQNYIVGEPRFTLKRSTDAKGYLVEDKIRPVPPAGLTYERESRGTCQEDWSSVGGVPLLARADGARLTVDLVKISPDRSSFEIKGTKIVGCNKLDASKATKIESTLTRE